MFTLPWVPAHSAGRPPPSGGRHHLGGRRGHIWSPGVSPARPQGAQNVRFSSGGDPEAARETHQGGEERGPRAFNAHPEHHLVLP